MAMNRNLNKANLRDVSTTLVKLAGFYLQHYNLIAT